VGIRDIEGRNTELIKHSKFQAEYRYQCMCEGIIKLCSWGDTLARSPSINQYCVDYTYYRIAQSKRRPRTFLQKMGEWALSESLKETFDTFKRKRHMDVKNIKDKTVRFVTQVISYKLLQKFCKDEVSTIIISVIEKCIAGVHMNQDTLLVSKFL